jgi:hypothetical protein
VEKRMEAAKTATMSGTMKNGEVMSTRQSLLVQGRVPNARQDWSELTLEGASEALIFSVSGAAGAEV